MHGSVCNIANLVHPGGRNISTVTTVTQIKAFHIEASILLKMMSENHHFEERVYQMSFQYFLSMHDIDFNPLDGEDEDKIVEISQQSKFHNVDIKTKLILKNGGFLIQGN